MQQRILVVFGTTDALRAPCLTTRLVKIENEKSVVYDKDV